MASRPQHSHDGGISERRLRPIYDWLDIGNNKKALQEADKVLKKSPSLQAARALKALALLRLGRGTEASSVLNALAEEKPSDDTTLQAMTISYRETQALDKVCELYENAIKSEPANEELHSHLFMSYVRVGDHRSQQRVAMALYKVAPKNPYYFWAVMSIVLQAKATDDKSKKGILLTLAQRMIDNFIADNKMEAEQEARLYIMILDLQEKWEEIIKFLEGPLFSNLVPVANAHASIPYLKQLKKWNQLNLLCKDMLLENQDRWDYYMPYFDSVFELMKDTSENDLSVDDTPEKCHEFICFLLELEGSGRTLRGPYLARLELCKRLQENGKSTELLGDPFALCVQYLMKFAHKPCAVPDLRTYLDTLPQSVREQRCNEFMHCLGYDENTCAKTSEDIQKHINCFGAWRICAPLSDLSTNTRLAEVLRGHYLRCLKDGLVTSTITEWSSADMYGVLAAHHYFYAALQSQSSKPVIEALSLLELVFHHSPANFHIKLLLVQLYHLIGNGYAADAIYHRLEIKHAQLVSLNWLHVARLTSCCVLQRALQLLSDTNGFYTHHAKDSIEHVTFAYKYGTWEKLLELEAWRGRVGRCVGGAGAHCRTLTAALAGPTPSMTTPPHLDYYTDNRDLNVILNWDPAQTQDLNYKTRSFEQETSMAKLRNYLLKSLILCTEISENKPMEEKSRSQEELKNSVEGFKQEWDSCKDKYKEKEKIYISKPFPSRIISFVTSEVPYRDLFSLSFTLVCDLSLESPVSNDTCGRLNTLVVQSRDLISRAVDDKLKCDDPVWFMREALEDLSHYLEFIGIITNILGMCNEILAPKNTKKVKRKAQNQSPEDAKTSQLLKNLNQAVQDCIVTIEQLLDKLPEYNTDTSIEKQFEQLSLTFKNPVPERLKISIQITIRDLKNMLGQKSKYLISLYS